MEYTKREIAQQQDKIYNVAAPIQNTTKVLWIRTSAIDLIGSMQQYGECTAHVLSEFPGLIVPAHVYIDYFIQQP